jgi:FkbM family methyltransferase
MKDSLLEIAFRLVRKVGGALSRMGLGRVPLFVDAYRLILRMASPSGERRITVNEYRMAVRLKRKGGFGDTGVPLVLDGQWEPLTTRYFKGLVKPGMRVVDVGANIGYYTLLAAKLVGPEGKVWAFEPEDENFADLHGNVLLNGYQNVVLLRKAVSDRDGRANLYISKDSGGHSLVRHRYAVRRKAARVRTVRLDSVIPEGVDIIKSDTEGNDIAVLRGGRRLLESNNDIKLILEFHATLLGAQYADELVSLLSAYGFKYAYILDDWEMVVKGGTLQELGRVGKTYKHAPNVLCSKTEIGERF